MEYRAYQYLQNVFAGEVDPFARANPRIKPHAGDWVVQCDPLEDGDWHNYDGPYAPSERQTCLARLKELRDAALPQLFDDLGEGDG